MALQTLGAHATGHDNNLNLMRVLAAASVLASHSVVVASGDPSAEPGARWLGISPGYVAVDAFFVISGFLVTASLVRRRSLVDFAVARALRIYPALWVALIASTAVVGLGFTSLAPAAFFTDRETWSYLARNAGMVTAAALLPGAFDGNPAPGHVNASLWTLRHELRLYVLLALLWWAVRRLAPLHEVERRFGIVLVALALPLVAAGIVVAPVGSGSEFLRLAAMFCSGAALHAARRHVVLRFDVASLLGAALVASALVSGPVFGTLYRLALPYLLFVLAYRPGGALRRYNRLGDFSYGVYIFAFPVQQMIEARVPGIGPAALTALALAATLPLAVVSWHVVEKPALRSRPVWVARLRRRRGSVPEGA